MFDKIEEALEELKKGKMIIVTDNEDRENEGDLLMPIENATPENINFMATHGRGLICAPLSDYYIDKLKLTQMKDDNQDKFKTAFTISIDHKDTYTGISAFVRSKTLLSLIDEKTVPSDLNRPGHIFPLHAKKGGVLVREGHTEAAVDFSRLAGFKEAGVICEIMKEDGTMARVNDLAEFKKKHNLKMVNISDLKDYMTINETFITKDLEVDLPSDFGTFQLHNYLDNRNDHHNVVLTKGDLKNGLNVRIHSECLTGDVFHSRRCDCQQQLEESMKIIEAEGGMIIYLNQEGRGIGLTDKLRAYKLQEEGRDTLEANLDLCHLADERTYEIAFQILKMNNISEIKLLTNNHDKINEMERFGIKVERREIEIAPNEFNEKYLKTKKNKMQHILREV